MSVLGDCLTSIGVDADGVAAEVGLGGAEVLLLPIIDSKIEELNSLYFLMKKSYILDILR